MGMLEAFILMALMGGRPETYTLSPVKSKTTNVEQFLEIGSYNPGPGTIYGWYPTQGEIYLIQRVTGSAEECGWAAGLTPLSDDLVPMTFDPTKTVDVPAGYTPVHVVRYTDERKSQSAVGDTSGLNFARQRVWHALVSRDSIVEFGMPSSSLWPRPF